MCHCNEFMEELTRQSDKAQHESFRLFVYNSSPDHGANPVFFINNRWNAVGVVVFVAVPLMFCLESGTRRTWKCWNRIIFCAGKPQIPDVALVAAAVA